MGSRPDAERPEHGPVQLVLFDLAPELADWQQEQVLQQEWQRLVAERRHLRVVR